jgi:glycosyltransferase involved in cell wall biosynthesis
MKIAFVTGHYPPFIGGIEVHVQQIVRRLVARGDEVTVLTQADGPAWQAEEVIEGALIQRFSVPLPSRHFAVSPALWRALRTRRSQWDIVHAHGYHSIAPFLAMSAGARPLVFTPHYHGTGHSPLSNAMHIPYRRIGATVIGAARSVICVSEAERRLFLGHFPSATGKTVVIPNGVDLEMLQAAEAFPTDKKTIVTGGRLVTYKHVDVTLRAVALLGEEWQLFIIGDGPERVHLEALAREIRMTNNVRFLGRIAVDDLYRWYRTADVYVSMSSNEAMPVTMLELLACGARVVCSDIPAHRDLSEKTKGPIAIVPLAATAAELARAIEAAIILSASQDLQVLTWGDVADSTRRVYEEVLGGTR